MRVDEMEGGHIPTINNTVMPAMYKDEPIKQDITSRLKELQIQPRQIRRNNTLLKQETLVVPEVKVEQEPFEITALNVEYDDMTANLEYIIDMNYLYSFYMKIPYSVFEQVGLQIHQKFFTKVFGPEYGVTIDEKYKEPETIKGGTEEYIAYQKALLDHIYATEGIEEAAAGGAGAAGAAPRLDDMPTFDKTKEFITTKFSVIELYNNIISRENKSKLKARIDRFASLRPREWRDITYKQLLEKQDFIRSLIEKIKKEEESVWEVQPFISDRKKKEARTKLGKAAKAIENATGEEENENEEDAAGEGVKPPLTGKKRGRENEGVAKQQVAQQSPTKVRRTNASTSVKKGKKTGGTRKIQKRYKFKTFKKRSKTNKRKTQRR
jgi:hypothetical protein